MSKAPPVDQKSGLKRLLDYLSQSGPSKAQSVCEHLKISQPTFSRLISQAPDSIIRIGRGPQTLYACHRFGRWNGGKPKIPVYIIDEKGTLSQTAILHSLSPRGFYLESQTDIFSNLIYENLPYFFEDLRPAGFLGRLVPRLHSELNLPPDIQTWTDDDCLLYLTQYGWDLIGQFIIGERACDLYREMYQKIRGRVVDVIDESQRERHYPRVAEIILSQGVAGSSAAGEHPKFLSILETKKGLLPVMVKFSPPVVDAVSTRVSDLLVCEHIAHEILEKYGKISLQSHILQSANCLFLEIERFDRNEFGGRHGIISLRALDLQFVGKLKSWSETAESLFQQKIIDQDTYQTIVWLEVFGKLIANTDRHHGNISFFCDGEKILGLAPVYDMLPMMYAPQQNQLVPRIFDPSLPKLDEKAEWESALSAAHDFWAQVQTHPQISTEFKILVADNEKKLFQIGTP